MEVKYDRIGTNYNSTRKADPYLTLKSMEHLCPGIDGIYLDISCGTGNYICELENNGLRMIGIDTNVIRPGLHDKFLYCGKHSPEIYFDNQISNGISSFSSLGNITMVEHGLTKLKREIDSGKINEIIDSCDHDFGDYLFIIGEKPHSRTNATMDEAANGLSQ